MRAPPDVKDIDTWTREDIREFYDLYPDLTILTFAGMLGMTGGEVIEILMEDATPTLILTRGLLPLEEKASQPETN